MRAFLEKVNRFLDAPLDVGPRVLLVVAVALLVPTYFTPLYNMTMFAPQYPEGLRLDIYSYKLEGGNDGQDVKEINVLNHYIGMKDLVTEDFTEFKWIPFVIGIFGLLFLRAAVLGKVSHLVDVLVLYVYFGALLARGRSATRCTGTATTSTRRRRSGWSPSCRRCSATRSSRTSRSTPIPQLGSYALGAVALVLAAGRSSSPGGRRGASRRRDGSPRAAVARRRSRRVRLRAGGRGDGAAVPAGARGSACRPRRRRRCRRASTRPRRGATVEVAPGEYRGRPRRSTSRSVSSGVGGRSWSARARAASSGCGPRTSRSRASTSTAGAGATSAATRPASTPRPRARRSRDLPDPGLPLRHLPARGARRRRRGLPRSAASPASTRARRAPASTSGTPSGFRLERQRDRRTCATASTSSPPRTASSRGNCARDLRYGLHYMFSDDNLFEDNMFENGAAGTAIMYSKRIVFRRNRFLRNRGFASVGLLFKTCDDVLAEDNLIADNARGIFLEGSYRNVFRRQRDRGLRRGDRALRARRREPVRGQLLRRQPDAARPRGPAHRHRLRRATTGPGNDEPDLDGDGRSDRPYRLVQRLRPLPRQPHRGRPLSDSFAGGAIGAAEQAFPVLWPRPRRGRARRWPARPRLPAVPPARRAAAAPARLPAVAACVGHAPRSARRLRVLAVAGARRPEAGSR